MGAAHARDRARDGGPMAGSPGPRRGGRVRGPTLGGPTAAD